MIEPETKKLDGNARDEILAAIRQSLAKSKPFDAIRKEHQHAAKPAPYPAEGMRSPISQAALIENFRTNLESVGGHCSVVSSESEASALIGELINRTASRRIAVSDSELVTHLMDEIDATREADRDFLFGCDIGITGAQWAIAETGTLVLESDAENHRLTSLVPPVHLCIVKADRIRQTLGEILNLTGADLSRTVTFITGASRTSDIELTLAIGVHGPAELHVIVVAD